MSTLQASHPLKCGYFAPAKDDICKSTKETHAYIIHGGVGVTTLSMCDTHVAVLRTRKPHWELIVIHSGNVGN